MAKIEISSGTIYYEEAGPEKGRPVVFVHGYWMGGQVWRQVSRRLGERGLRCIAPTWPMGAQSQPLHPNADRTITGIAGIVAEVLERLDLSDVVLVGNDSGGVVAQLVAVHHPERIGSLVLTSCDAFEHFPPPILRPMILSAKSKLLFRCVIQALRLPAARKRAYGGLAHRDIEELAQIWVRPALSDPAIAEDLRQLTLSFRTEVTTGVAARLSEFDGPALVAWSAEDVFFPLGDGERLAATLPNARLEVIDGARTFSMLDQPQRLADLMFALARV
jgi:pimeloyl-ACP methyl ester carboxylesterase